jgi:hypothetical protein
VIQKVFRGDHCLLELQCDAERFSFSIPCWLVMPKEGDILSLSIPPESILFFGN